MGQPLKTTGVLAVTLLGAVTLWGLPPFLALVEIFGCRKCPKLLTLDFKTALVKNWQNLGKTLAVSWQKRAG